MTMHKQHTEPIFTTLSGYRAALSEHPLLRAARAGELERRLLHEFALHQVVDSFLWIPMLAQMKTKALKSRRLRRAIEENIAHEAGLHTESHVTLAVALARSLGASEEVRLPGDSLTDAAEYWLSDAFARSSEPAIAGWLLVAESLVPILFAAVAPAFDALGCDTRYLYEHVHVDADEHATWMAEAVAEVLDIYGVGCIPEIEEGMAEAWAETTSVPDALWARRPAA